MARLDRPGAMDCKCEGLGDVEVFIDITLTGDGVRSGVLTLDQTINIADLLLAFLWAADLLNGVGHLLLSVFPNYAEASFKKASPRFYESRQDSVAFRAKNGVSARIVSVRAGDESRGSVTFDE